MLGESANADKGYARRSAGSEFIDTFCLSWHLPSISNIVSKSLAYRAAQRDRANDFIEQEVGNESRVASPIQGNRTIDHVADQAVRPVSHRAGNCHHHVNDQ